MPSSSTPSKGAVPITRAAVGLVADSASATRVASLREMAGLALGLLLAPLVARISRARRARMFHPEGSTYSAVLEAQPGLEAHWRELAERLSGPALLRFSGALWRGGFEHLDVLGIALRLRRTTRWSEAAQPGDQDLLLATIRSPFTLLLAPFTTRPRDYLANHYWAVSPFDVGQGRHVKFRLSPCRTESKRSAELNTRNRALRAQVLAGQVQLMLEVRDTTSRRYRPLALVRVLAPLPLDQAALRFSAFHNGRGVVPSGFVHALRRATYAASQRARPAAEGAPATFAPLLAGTARHRT